MVIQRIQSVYLLIAIILMAVFAFFPALSFELGGRIFVYGALEAGKVGVTHVDPLMLMLIILIVFLAIVDIFLFKKRILQARLNIFLAVLCLGYYGIMGIYVWHCKANLHFDPLNWHMTASMMIPVICFVDRIDDDSGNLLCINPYGHSSYPQR